MISRIRADDTDDAAVGCYFRDDFDDLSGYMIEFRKIENMEKGYDLKEYGIDHAIGKKIVVLGNSGSGKSTFSIKLHEYTGLPLIHLDNIWWKKDRTHISREEFDEKLEEVLKGDEWIIDGSYSRTFEMRFQACDTVFFLDYDDEVCLNAIQGRVGKYRPDIPWIDHELDPELVQLVLSFRTKNRPRIYELIEKYPRITYIFKNREEADLWLKSLSINEV